MPPPAGLTIRAARRDDLAVIVRLLADDTLGRGRERVEEPLPAAYGEAFAAIAADPNQELVVACREGAVVGVLQLTVTPHIVNLGAWRATVEGVRVDRAHRSQGIGAALLEWVVARARARGCALVQLTSDVRRRDARRFYERHGFVASHTGFKRPL